MGVLNSAGKQQPGKGLIETASECTVTALPRIISTNSARSTACFYTHPSSTATQTFEIQFLDLFKTALSCVNPDSDSKVSQNVPID